MISKLIVFAIMFVVALFIWIFLPRNEIYGKQPDKRKHLIISAILSIIVGSITFIVNNPIWYFIGMGTSLLVGIAKELSDKFFHTGTFEWFDLLADLVGACILAPFTLFTIATFINLF